VQQDKVEKRECFATNGVVQKHLNKKTFTLMGENWDNCIEFIKVILVSIICFPFLPVVILYWYFHAEEVRQTWQAIQIEENEEIEIVELNSQVDRQQLRNRVSETEQFWAHLRTRFLRQYGLDSDSIN
jgi:hypothetical protein